MARRRAAPSPWRSSASWRCRVLVASALPPRSAAPATRQADGPNVVLIFLDTVRYDAVFDADGRVHSGLPALARLRAGSIALTRAYSTAPWTLPAHLSALTGLQAYELGVSFDSQEHARGRTRHSRSAFTGAATGPRR